MTYLELVNKVLIRLREDTVSTVSQTPYSALIGEFVNDAKQLVEDAWDWSALRTTLTVTTSADVFNYNLTGSDNRVKILDVVNDTSNFFLRQQTSHWFNNTFLNADPAKGAPMYYTFNGVNENNDSAVDVYPIPNGVYNLRFNCVLRTPELVNDSDEINIPNLPIIHYAVATATSERGEAGTRTAPELLGIASQVLSDAIALDAIKHPEETVYVTV